MKPDQGKAPYGKPFGPLEVLVLLLAVAASAWLLTGIGKPLRNEDIGNFYYSYAILKHGIPRIYYGLGEVFGLAHPPLHPYINAFFIQCFGWGDAVLRLPSVTGAIASFFLGWGFLRSEGKGERVWVLALVMLCGIPLAQSMLVPDIDGTLLAPLGAGLLWALSSAKKGGGVWRWALVTLLSALFVSAKWVTPPFLLGFWLVFFLVHPAFKKIAGQAALAFALGTLAAVVAYLAWSVWTRISPLDPFEFTFLNKGLRLAWASAVGLRLESLIHGVAGIAGPGLLLLIAVAWRSRERNVEHSQAALLLLSGAALLAFYSLAYPAFSVMVWSYKYLAPGIVFFGIGLALVWDGSLPALQGARAAGLAVAAIAAPFAYPFLDWVHNHSARRLELAWLLLPLLLAPVLKQGRLAWAPALMAAGVASSVLRATLFFGLGALSPVDSSASYPTTERGFTELVRNPPAGLRGRVIVGSYEACWYLSPDKGLPSTPWWHGPARLKVPLEERPLAARFAALWPWKVDDWNYYPSLNIGYSEDTEAFSALLNGPVEAVVDTPYQPLLLNPAIRSLVESRFPVRHRVGDYTVYMRP